MPSAASRAAVMPAAATRQRPGGGRRAEVRQLRLLFDLESRHIIDGCGAAQGLLGYEPSELRGMALGQLFEDGEDGTAGRTSGEWLATLLTRQGRRLVLGAQLHQFRRGQGEGALALLHLRELQPPPARARDEGARQRLQTLAYELTVAEARERERIANGLHDSLGQLLAIAQFRLGELAAALEPAAGAPQARLAHKANELMALLAQASGETRRATFDLHSPLLRQLGLRAAIEGLGERLQRQSQLVVQVDGELDETSLAEPVQAVLLRIVRELLLNAYKHARATQVQVHLGADETGRAQIRVCDDGCGFTRAPGGAGFSPEGGFGLASAEAQMQAIGGQLAVRSAPGQGAAVVLTLPRRRGNRAARTLQ